MTPETASADAGFSKSLEFQGIGFKVEANDGNLAITPTGLAVSNDPVTSIIEGDVYGAEAADLDADGSPEVYVFLKTGEDARGGMVGYATNKRRSMSRIAVPAIAENASNNQGYRGHDEFALLGNRIGQRFPIFGNDGRPTGNFRQLQYKLVPGEAGWRLIIEQTAEF